MYCTPLTIIIPAYFLPIISSLSEKIFCFINLFESFLGITLLHYFDHLLFEAQRMSSFCLYIKKKTSIPRIRTDAV